MTSQDHFLRARVDAVHRLVEQEHVAFLREGASDEHPLLLAAGQLADLRAAICDHADPLEHAVDDFAVVGAGPA